MIIRENKEVIKRENLYIYETLSGLSHTKTTNKNSNNVLENQIYPLKNQISHMWGVRPTLRTTGVEI